MTYRGAPPTDPPEPRVVPASKTGDGNKWETYIGCGLILVLIVAIVIIFWLIVNGSHNSPTHAIMPVTGATTWQAMPHTLLL